MFVIKHTMKYFYFLFSLPLKVSAVYLPSVVYDMPSDKSFISRKIYNNTEKQNIYNISAYKIDRPGKGGEHKSPLVNGELLYAPLSLSLSQNSVDYIKIFYKGPNDDKERYYRIVYRETPASMFKIKDRFKYGEVIPVVSMDTILIVRPRKMNFSYNIDEINGVLNPCIKFNAVWV